MAMTTQSCHLQDKMEVLDSVAVVENAVLEEIDGDVSAFGIPSSPIAVPPSPQKVEETLTPPESPAKTGRDFGNISPISELLDEDDLDVGSSAEEKEPGEDAESSDSVGKVTPEPGPHPGRASFPRISDGRSSPILAYSPSLIKSPPSNGTKSRLQLSPSSGGGSGGGAGKRPRNIARMLDNISDHSSGEEEVNSVGMMMAKFTV